jgi:hypothetical protein
MSVPDTHRYILPRFDIQKMMYRIMAKQDLYRDPRHINNSHIHGPGTQFQFHLTVPSMRSEVFIQHFQNQSDTWLGVIHQDVEVFADSYHPDISGFQCLNDVYKWSHAHWMVEIYEDWVEDIIDRRIHDTTLERYNQVEPMVTGNWWDELGLTDSTGMQDSDSDGEDSTFVPNVPSPTSVIPMIEARPVVYLDQDGIPDGAVVNEQIL